jgi:hypothetical protein
MDIKFGMTFFQQIFFMSGNFATSTYPNSNRLRFLLKLHDPTSTRNKFHDIADISTIAYTAVIYLNSIFAGGSINVSLFIKKSWVSPLKLLFSSFINFLSKLSAVVIVRMSLLDRFEHYTCLTQTILVPIFLCTKLWCSTWEKESNRYVHCLFC